MKRNKAQKAIAAALSATLVFSGAAVPALATPSSSELKSQLSDAQAKLNSLYARAEQASEDLNQTKVELDQTNSKINSLNSDIEKTQAELKEKQAVLSKRVAANYKYGDTDLLSILLGSDSFDALTSNIVYANKVSEKDSNAINDVKTLESQLSSQKSELEEQKASQEKLVADKKAQSEALNAQSQKAQDYVNSLSSEVQKALADEQAAREAAARKAAEEAAAKAQANGGAYYTPDNNASAQGSAGSSKGNSDSGKSNNSGSNSSKGNTNSGTNSSKGNAGTGSNAGASSNKGNGGSSSNAGGSSNKGSSSVSGAWRNTVIAAATRMVGGTYVWGASDPGSKTFDCSGLTSYAYGVAGIGIDHSSALQASFCTKPVSQAVPGDVVWRPGHVGIYIGGGVTIEAFSPSQGIGYGSVSSFSRCGSPV